MLPIYNKERVISLSIINDQTMTIEAIYRFNIVPITDFNVIDLEFFRKANARTYIHLPFLNCLELSQNVDNILVDDPKAIIHKYTNFLQKNRVKRI
jgi:hypothetical protein